MAWLGLFITFVVFGFVCWAVRRLAWYVSAVGFVSGSGLGIGAWKAGGRGPSSILCAGPSFSKHLGGKGVVVAAHRVVMVTLCI